MMTLESLAQSAWRAGGTPSQIEGAMLAYSEELRSERDRLRKELAETQSRYEKQCEGTALRIRENVNLAVERNRMKAEMERVEVYEKAYSEEARKGDLMRADNARLRAQLASVVRLSSGMPERKLGLMDAALAELAKLEDAR